MNVRPLTEDEKNDALNLAKEVFFAAGSFHLSKQESKSFLDYLSDHGMELSYFGAYERDLKGVIGYDPDTFHIALFFVRKEDQGKGIGKALMHRLIQEAEAAGISRVSVTALETAVHAYEALGFEKEGAMDKSSEIGFQPMEYLLGKEYLGTKADVIVEIPYGSMHPAYADETVTCNEGYVEQLAKKGIFVTAYCYGLEEPCEVFHGTVIAIIYHKDSSQGRWIVSSTLNYKKEDVINAVAFEEQYHDVRIEWMKQQA